MPRAATNTSAGRIGQAVNLVHRFCGQKRHNHIWLIEAVMICWGSPVEFRIGQDGLGPVDIGVDHHEAAGNRTDATFQVRDVTVEFYRLDPCIDQKASDVRDQDGIVGAQNFLHADSFVPG